MDIVYLVRIGDRNEELRHSLRTLRNLPHERVWLVGYRPTWVKNVEHIPFKQTAHKWRNLPLMFMRACEHPEMAEEFVIFNDDFFVMSPVPEMPMFHRGSLLAHSEKNASSYSRTLKQTYSYLIEHGVPDPLSYEVHAPMPVNKERFAEAVTRPGLPHTLQVRSLYGNWYRTGGEQTSDFKSFKHWDPSWGFLSTNDGMFRGHDVGRFIRDRFPGKCRYER